MKDTLNKLKEAAVRNAPEIITALSCAALGVTAAALITEKQKWKTLSITQDQADEIFSKPNTFVYYPKSKVYLMPHHEA